MEEAGAVSRRHALALAAVLPVAAIAACTTSSTAEAQTPEPKFVAVTGPLSTYIAGIQTARIPDEHRDLAKQHILDTLASVVACRDLEPSILARKYADLQSGGATKNSATMLGARQRASLSDAVFASAMTAHAAEINDFIPSAFVQPGPSIVSVALGLAETRRGISGDALIRAVIAGYELAGRVPKALGNANLRNAGIANHGVGPVFGAATTAASLVGIPENRIADLLSYCAQQSSGSWQWLMDVEHIEKAFVFAGMGARNGLQAALMVEAGFRGVRDAMDNPEGWMRAGAFAAGDANPAYLVEDLGVRSELNETAFKRYPVGGPTQPAIHGMYQLLPKIDRNKVASVRVEMPGRWQAFRDAAMPALNLRYTLSLMLVDGRLDFVSAQSLQRMAMDSKVRALMDLVTIAHDPAQEAPTGKPRAESARLVVIESDGKRHEIYVPYVDGFPSHPMSRDEVEAKAVEMMSPGLGAPRAKQVVERVRDLEAMKDVEGLVGMIGR